MKFQDSSFNGLKVTVGTKSVTHAPTHPLTHAPKAICPINFFKVGGIKMGRGGGGGAGSGCGGGGGGGQGGCEQRIEVFVKIQKKKLGWGREGGGVRFGGSGWM